MRPVSPHLFCNHQQDHALQLLTENLARLSELASAKAAALQKAGKLCRQLTPKHPHERLPPGSERSRTYQSCFARLTCMDWQSVAYLPPARPKSFGLPFRAPQLLGPVKLSVCQLILYRSYGPRLVCQSQHHRDGEGGESKPLYISGPRWGPVPVTRGY